MNTATPQEMLQALATLNRNVHMMRSADADDIDLWLRLAGAQVDTRNLSDKTLENVGVMYRRYFEG